MDLVFGNMIKTQNEVIGKLVEGGRIFSTRNTKGRKVISRFSVLTDSSKNKLRKKSPNLPPIPKKHEIIAYKKIQLKSTSHYKGNQNQNLMSTDNEELIAQIYYSKKIN